MRTPWHKTPAGEAYHKARLQSPEWKAYNRAYQETLRQDPEYKASMKAYQKAYRQRPEAKAKEQARNQTPERRAYSKSHDLTPGRKAQHKAWQASPAGKAWFKAQARSRREAPFTWSRVNPWPTDCVICGLAFEGAYPDARSESLGHEPPIVWMLRQPEYSGALVLRPEHFACNVRKSDNPDWEI